MLWFHLVSLAATGAVYAEVGREAHQRYCNGLGRLIAAARPDLWPADVARRAADIVVIQNGLWCTSALDGGDDGAVERAIERCEAIAFAD